MTDRKPKRKKRKTTKPKTVLVLRTCNADMTSPSAEAKGFKWPKSGPVACKDWSPEPEFGHGLHGLLWGEGDGTLMNWSADAKWLVVAVTEFVKIDHQKVKFPRGEVVHCGDRKSATDYLIERLTKSAAVVGASVNSGYMGTSTSGYMGTSTSGYRGTSTSGYRGTSTSGYRGTSTSGDWGILQLKFFDSRANRTRIVTLYVGENGIKPNVKYRLNDKHEPEEVP